MQIYVQCNVYIHIIIYIYISSSHSLVSVLLLGEKRPAKSGNSTLKEAGSALAPGTFSKKVYMNIYIYTHAHIYIHRRFKDHRGHEHIYAYMYTGLTSN